MEYLGYEIEELMPIVIRLAEKYTSKESTSITYEAASHLMEAVQYCIREYATNEEETGLIKRNSNVKAEEAYAKGYEIVLNKVDCIRRMYHVVLPKFKAYGNENYQDTFTKGIPAFIRHYDPRFSPQDEIITMDYPVLYHLEKLQGVDAVEKYMEAIRLEQKFLGKLPDAYVRGALEAYDIDYERQFFNICSIVLGRLLRDMIGDVIPEKEHLKIVSEGYLKILIKEQYGDSEELFEYLKEDI